jgi:type IV pilus assembly protein PilE
MNRNRGFTLIELMIVVAILGLLAAVAYPAYGRYLVNGNRAAAQSHMLELALAESQYFADTRSYAGTVGALGMTTPTAVSSKYTISIATTASPPTFTITARPVVGSSQAAEPDLTINNAGTKTPGGKW